MDRTHFINPPKKRIKNKGSTALSRFDNQKLFSLYEYDSFSIVAAICQMLYLKTGTTRQWRCAASGVLCFTKDYKKKAYLLRMYCLEKRKCIWEEPL
uniref:WH1 domain-containing protein n=1 Tax=Rhabditophanes sp. KR3021 TaxID=114890 RepID=A0AC35TST2_9BILA